MKKVLSVFCLLIMATFWYSCTKDTAPVIGSGTQTGNCDTTKVSFTLRVMPIINSTCLGSDCHSSGTAQQDFTKLIVVKADIDDILCRIHAAGTSPCGARMPQGLPALPDSVTAVFAKWKTDNFYDCH